MFQFAGSMSQPIMYAILVLDLVTLQHLGKKLLVSGKDSVFFSVDENDSSSSFMTQEN